MQSYHGAAAIDCNLVLRETLKSELLKILCHAFCIARAADTQHQSRQEVDFFHTVDVRSSVVFFSTFSRTRVRIYGIYIRNGSHFGKAINIAIAHSRLGFRTVATNNAWFTLSGTIFQASWSALLGE